MRAKTSAYSRGWFGSAELGPAQPAVKIAVEVQHLRELEHARNGFVDGSFLLPRELALSGVAHVSPHILGHQRKAFQERYPVVGLKPALDEQQGHQQAAQPQLAAREFEAIHPFRDGNGRTGRVFNIHYLAHKGLLDYPRWSVRNSLSMQLFTKIKHLTEQRLYVENTARKYFNQLVDMGILAKKVIASSHYYSNLKLHRILSE